ncbi:MAG: hypothetical protein ABW252_07445 [Polyangiales bacterium]
MTKSVSVGIGDQLFDREDGLAFGAVLAVHKHELLVTIEGFGQAMIPSTAVRAVHDGKIIIDVTDLPSDLQQTISRAHDRETDY